MRRFYLLTSGIFLILALITCRGYIHHIDSRLGNGDNLFIAWTLAWDNHAELTGNLLHIFNANIYYPNQDTLAYSENLLGASVLTLPIYAISNNPVLLFTFLLILSFILNALCAEILASYYLKNKYAIFIVGLIWGFCAYKVWGMSHLQNILCWWIPLGMYFLIKFFDTRKRKDLILFFTCFVLQLYFGLAVGLAMAFLALFMVVYFLISYKAYNLLPKFVVGSIISAILLIPMFYPYVWFNRQTHAAFAPTDLDQYSADFGGYLLPSQFQLESNFINLNKIRWTENFEYIGYIALVLAIIGLISINFSKGKLLLNIDLSKDRLMFILLGIIFSIFSLGYHFWLNDKITSIKLPYELIFKYIRIIDFVRVTSRYTNEVMLTLALFAGYGFLKILGMFKSKKSWIVVTIIFSVLIYLEYVPIAWPGGTFIDAKESNIPSIYSSKFLKKDNAPLVNLPFSLDIQPNIYDLYYSTANWHPLMNGYSGYRPEWFYTYITALNDFPAQDSIDLLKKLKVKYVIIDNSLFPKIPVLPKEVKLLETSGKYSLYELI